MNTTVKLLAPENTDGLAHPSAKDWERYIKLFHEYKAPTIARIMELLKMRNELAVAKCPRKLFTTKTRMIANSIFRQADEKVRLMESEQTIDKPLQEKVFHLYKLKIERK